MGIYRATDKAVGCSYRHFALRVMCGVVHRATISSLHPLLPLLQLTQHFQHDEGRSLQYLCKCCSYVRAFTARRFAASCHQPWTDVNRTIATVPRNNAVACFQRCQNVAINTLVYPILLHIKNSNTPRCLPEPYVQILIGSRCCSHFSQCLCEGNPTKCPTKWIKHKISFSKNGWRALINNNNNNNNKFHGATAPSGPRPWSRHNDQTQTHNTR